MQNKLIRFVVYTFLSVAFALMFAANATAKDEPTFQLLNLALYNLSDHQITVNWTDSNNIQQTATVDAQSMLFMTQGNIPTNSEAESDDLYTVQIQDGTAERNTNFSLSANDCELGLFMGALKQFPSFCEDTSITKGSSPLSYAITGSNLRVCLKGPTSAELNTGSINFNISGATNILSSCDLVPTDVPVFLYAGVPGGEFPYPPTGSDAIEPIALGSYSPTNGPPFNSQVLPGLSPTGVSPCIGGECTIPSGVDTWPVTIYYDVTPDPSTPGAYVPAFQYNSSNPNVNPESGLGMFYLGNLGTGMGYQAINQSSFISNYGVPLSPNTYVPIADTFPGIDQIPLPCWPLLSASTGAYQCNGPAIYNTSSVASDAPKSHSIAKIVKDTVYLTTDLVGLF